MFELSSVGVNLGGKAVLDGVDLFVEQGSRVAVVGRSGSGKSTLLRLLSFMQLPSIGRVLFRGETPGPRDVAAVRRKVPMVHQEPLLWDETVADNLTLPFSYDSAAGLEAPPDSMLAELLEIAGLDSGLLHSSAKSLSGGEKQRVAIARALALGPEAILLDEPTSALDLLTAESLFDSLTAHFPELTVVLVTHSPSLVERCSRQVLLEDGRVRASRDGMRAGDLRQFLESGQ